MAGGETKAEEGREFGWKTGGEDDAGWAEVSEPVEDNSQFDGRFNDAEKQILAILAKHSVPFFIDGSVACCFHGTRKVYECTNDIDIVLSPDFISANKFAAAATEIEQASGISIGFNPAELALPKKQFRLPTVFLDFRTCESKESFEMHYVMAAVFELADNQVRIASVNSLIQMKNEAIEANQEVEKHHADVLRLRALR